MAVRITKRVNVSRRVGEKLRPLKKQLKTELESYKKELQTKVKSGKGFDNKKLGSYKSKSYKAKRKARGKQTRFVDLDFSGKLLKSLKTKVRSSDNSIQGFLTVEDAKKGKVKGMQDRYSWFGITQKDLKTIVRNLKNILRRN